eukprot:gene12324-5998_t
MDFMYGYFEKETKRKIIYDPQKGSVLYKNQKYKKNEKNWIRTTAYTWYNFVLKNIFEQFYYRHANIHFLVVALLSLIPKLSPVGSFGGILTVAAVLLIQMVKDFVDDVFRFIDDQKINFQKCKIFQNGEWKQKRWQNIKTGDILKIENMEQFPCDLVLLDSSDTNGSCFVETSGLDGETDLKYRRVSDLTFNLFDHIELKDFNFSIVCDAPNTDVHKFHGNLIWDEKTQDLSNENVLLRGSSLRNTDWIIGAVVYSGKQTKLFQNMDNSPNKKSVIDKIFNKYIYAIFLILLLLCFICSFGGAIWLYVNSQFYWYLNLDESDLSFWHFLFIVIRSFGTHYILLSQIIPLALYVNMELTKFAEAKLLTLDTSMMYSKKDILIPAKSKTPTIMDDLGIVNIIFSDKTGTLTANEMKLLKCSIKGNKYGTGMTEISKSLAERK